jgi:hypothetical protein
MVCICISITFRSRFRSQQRLFAIPVAFMPQPAGPQQEKHDAQTVWRFSLCAMRLASAFTFTSVLCCFFCHLQVYNNSHMAQTVWRFSLCALSETSNITHSQ